MGKQGRTQHGGNFTLSYLYPSRLPRRQDSLDRMLGDETEVSASRLHVLGFGFESGSGLVEVDFLRAEGQGVAGCVGELVGFSLFTVELLRL